MPTCPHCGHEADASADECPLCGTPLAARAGEGEPTAPPAGAAAGPVPWEDPDLGFAEGIWRTWRESLFEPSRFFARIREQGTVVRALLYYLLVTVAASFVTLLWETQGLTLARIAGYARMGESAAAGPVISFVLAPFLALFLLLVLTLVFHLGALMVAPGRRGMGATAKVVCYASGPSVLAVVPILGTAVGAVWSLVLQVVGLREAHRTDTWRAIFMVFWLWLAFFLLGFLLAALFAALDGGGGGALAAAEGAGTAPLWHLLQRVGELISLLPRA